VKKFILYVIALVLVAALSVVGTVSYLTSRDSEVNVFTLGNVYIELTESFEQGSALMPGVQIEKTPVITNVGKNDAWVWLTFSIPAELDGYIRWTAIPATTAGSVNDNTVAQAVAQGYLPTDITAADILAGNKTWSPENEFVDNNGVKGSFYAETREVDGEDVPYHTYVVPYNTALKPGETTLPSIVSVALESYTDTNDDGDLYYVKDGKIQDLGWNINERGCPVIFAGAYAVQWDGFDSVQDAFNGYLEQWDYLN